MTPLVKVLEYTSLNIKYKSKDYSGFPRRLENQKDFFQSEKIEILGKVREFCERSGKIWKMFEEVWSFQIDSNVKRVDCKALGARSRPCVQ